MDYWLTWPADWAGGVAAPVCGSWAGAAGTSDAVLAGRAAVIGWLLTDATSLGDGAGATGCGTATACCCGVGMAVSAGAAVAVLLLRTGLAEADFMGAIGSAADAALAEPAGNVLAFAARMPLGS